MRIYWAREVTFDYTTDNAKRVDSMKFKPVNNTVSGIEKGDFYCYEVKSSVKDFHSKNGHNFLGDYNHYVMPEEVYESRAKLERDVGYSILKDSKGKPVFLDELDPNRGNMNTEIFPDCGIMCYLAESE